MDLSTLRFVVDTKQLEDAALKLEALGTAVNKLNKPLADNAKATATVVKEQAKAEASITKVAVSTEKLEQSQSKSTESTKKSISVLEKQNLILEYMVQGNSRGQASIMATYKAAGALDDQMLELTNTLKTQRTLIGTDPFDKSIGAVEAWTNRLKIATEVQSLYNRNLGLTKGQMEELARDKLRLNELFKDKGIAATTAEYEKLVKVASETASTINAVTASVKNEEKWLNETAKANAYLEKEMHRLDSTLQETNKNLGSGSINALIRFENALKKSGMTVEDQINQLDIFKKKLEETNKVSGNRQVNYLARALGPQITDIGVGLMTGQNPLTVILQQGGQLRDQLALANVAGKDMGKALQDAAAGMVGSIKDVGVAIGGLVVNSFTSAGKAALKFGGDVTGVAALMENLRYQVTLLEMSTGGNSTTGLAKAFNFASKALEIFTGGLVLGAAALGIAFLVSLKEVTKQESELTKAVTLSGGALGLSSDQALALSKSFAGAKGNIGDFNIAITAAAKAGTISADNLEAVTSAAVALNKAAGIPIEDTIKQFSKLGEKPTEAIRELAKSSGLLSPEILKSVQALERQGKQTEAVTLAINAFSSASKEAAKNIETDMGDIESLFHKIGSAASWMYDQIANKGRKGDLETQLKAAEDQLQHLKSISYFGIGDINNNRQVKEQVDLIFSLKQQIENSKKLGEEKLKNTAYAEWEIKYGKYAEQSLSKQARFEAERVKLKEASIAAGITEVQQAVALAGLRKEIFGEAALPNNLEIAQKAYGEDLKLAQSTNENKRKILKFYYDIGLKDRAEYVNEDAALLEGSEAAQLAVIESYQKKFTAAYNVQYTALAAKTGVGSQDVLNLKAKFEELNKTLENTKKTIADAIDTRSVENMRAIGEVIKESKQNYIEFSKTVDSAQAKRTSNFEAEKELAGAYGDTADRIKAARDAYNNLIPAITKANAAVKQAQKNLEEANAGPAGNLAIDAVNRTKADLAKITAEAQVEMAKSANDAISMKYLKNVEALSLGLSDAVLIGLNQGGKEGAKKIRDLVKAELMKPITIFVQAVVSGVVQGALGNSAGASGSSLLGSAAGSIIGSLGSKELAAAFSSGALTSAFGAGFKAAWGGSTASSAGAAGMLEGGAAAGTSTAGTAGFYAGQGAGAVGGVYLNKTLSNGYEINKTYSALQDIATVAAAFVPIIGPMLALGGGAVSGLTNRAFGRKLTDTGIQGTFGGTQGFSGQSYSFEKGGWFRSDKTTTGELSTGIQSGLASNFRLLQKGMIDLAESTGLGTDAISKYTTFMRVNLKDLSEEAAGKAIQGQFDAMAEQMAKLTLGTNKYNKQGETNLQTLTRLSIFMTGINTAFSNLGIELYKLTTGSLDAAQAFVDLFGGIEKFNTTMTYFYENFYSEQDKATNLTKDLTNAFAALGLALPETRDQFKNLVIQAKNLGNDSLVVGILSLQEAFAKLVPAVDTVAESAAKAEAAMLAINDKFKELLSTLVTTATSALDKQISLSKTAAEKAYSASKTYASAAEALRKVSADLNLAGLNTVETASALKETLKGIFTKAATGNAEAMGQLGTASTSYLDAYKQVATTKADYLKQTALVKRQLELTASAADVLGVSSDYQARLYDVQTAILEVTKEGLNAGSLTATKLQEQLDALNNIGTLIQDSGTLQVKAIGDSSTGIKGALVTNSGAVVGAVASNTILNLDALRLNSSEFVNSITGQNLVLGSLSTDQVQALRDVEGVQTETSKTTDIVAQATGGSETLLSAVLNRLTMQDDGSASITRALKAGNLEVTNALLDIKSAITQQSEAQAKELKRQADLAKAKTTLADTFALQQKTITGVNQGITNIKTLASTYGVGLLNKSGGAADFSVKDSLFTSDYSSISYQVGREAQLNAFKEQFYKAGGVYDQTYGQINLLAQLANQLEEARKIIRASGEIPAFASGGQYSGGLALVGEQGPELINFNNSGMVYNNKQTRGMLDNSSLIEELQGLRQEVIMLRSETRATVVNTSKTAKLLDRVVESDTLKVQTIVV